MAQPLLAPYKLTLSYTADTLQHNMSVYCSAFNASGIYTLYDRATTPLDTAQNCADSIYTALAPLYYTGTNSFGPWVLYQHVAPNYIPVASGTTAVAPSGTTNGTTLGKQATWYIRSVNYQIVKLAFFEDYIGVPFRWRSFSQLPAAYQPFWAALSTQSGVNMGNFILSKAGNPIGAPLAVTGALNRRIRRRRGIA
jgi:hypothetical protein